ncbi:hypothetical protein DRW03_14650 [Corallococcus sp. H22C18031201]|uniref:DUF2270 domain-containing protein n=1 Tax=Citreicoccus inhibens TaxID=2849499 RepID=UPI000E746D4B|nr:DUF2270 domain-containing protein [Citreicoccus inhibens]MBU8895416.1 DUF2270 domain-containing protein [Citreicoccus inhibens]RJS22548.1 hypothetical protein DRW03_14650 [Corallococcus sp. H22C18031201]
MPTNDRRQDDLEQPLLSEQSMAQLYRGELSRSDTWRTRLDTTTNWALTTTAAVISFGFASPDSSHVTFLVGIWMVVSFLLIEARRYRYYDLWNRRVRLLEDGWWAPMLRREPVDPDALRELAVEMSRPQIQLSLSSAIATRLNRAYGPILMVLLVTWFFKVYSHPRPPDSLEEFLDRAHVAWIPGVVVMGTLIVITLAAAYLFLASLFIRAPLGELRTRPRGRRAALWESFYRPYAIHHRRRTRRPPVAPPGPPAPRPPSPPLFEP